MGFSFLHGTALLMNREYELCMRFLLVGKNVIILNGSVFYLQSLMTDMTLVFLSLEISFVKVKHW